MFKHILVPTDLTERSLNALAIAVKLALREESRITLLHVIETIQDTELDDFSDFYEKLGRRASRKMEQMISQYREGQLTIQTEITYGKRVKEIIHFATNQEIDLIILSSHKIEADNAVQGWGTISYKVSILSHCPVMLVK
ncbi:MAG: universal stress protein [Deltaproteobacteria bacterium]|jgi:nucleotide-binding universal stress UspA family protein|nr:universal stress protein [Deltaproteobacteria bacterium]